MITARFNFYDDFDELKVLKYVLRPKDEHELSCWRSCLTDWSCTALIAY